MKRLIGIAAVCLLLVVASPVGAQTVPEESSNPDPSQAEADYRYQFDLYRNLYLAYQTTKAEYLKTKSLKAEQEALAAVKALAIARAEVLRTYNRWIMLQLLALQTPFPQVGETVARLETQFNWYLEHKAKIQAAASVTAFETVMEEYVSLQRSRDKLYALAQIDLKLARLAFFQQQMRALYDPILVVLQPQISIPEVEQGLARVTSLGEQINTQILETRAKAGAIESEDLEVNQVFRQTSERLENLRTLQLTLVNTMMELETRYVR